MSWLFIVIPVALMYLQACRRAAWILQHPRDEATGVRYYDTGPFPLWLLPIAMLIVLGGGLWEMLIMVGSVFSRPARAVNRLNVSPLFDKFSSVPVRERETMRKLERERVLKRGQELEQELLDKS